MKTRLTDLKSYPIWPDDIETSIHFFDSFGHSETEVSANYIVRLCKRKGGWLPFTEEDIEAFYNEAGHTNFYFNRLITGEFVQLVDGKYHVTHEFVARCFLAAPNLRRSNA